MRKRLLYQDLLSHLTNNVEYIIDKPLETPESTLKVLWYSTCGVKKTVESVQEIKPGDLQELSAAEVDNLKKLIEKRKANIPLAYIVGIQQFMGLDLLVDKRALIPRKETELLAEKALEILSSIKVQKQRRNVIDVCCGSGNLGLSIAMHNPDAHVFVSDLTDDAVSLTKENIDFLGLTDRVEAFQGDFLEAYENDKFYDNIDLIVCNPPYISSSKVSKMHAEISQNEPKEAFDGGMMGIRIIQRLISESSTFLKSGGWIAFEIGVGQGDFVLKFMERANKYGNIDSVRDGKGNIRVIVAQKI